ncbi:hypothetical protein CUD01_07080 [Cellulomonas uda]|uniref:Uncharacterized protein n=1 Tax=Cellulomonas uda TaxID=1714 RepID=A0A4Y3KA21_CELUD|nr:hypothetical protein CUD01_07080 [Cellulomonas uda]
MIAPIDVPTTTWGTIPRSNSARSIPTCTAPRTPPPPSTNPTLMQPIVADHPRPRDPSPRVVRDPALPPGMRLLSRSNRGVGAGTDDETVVAPGSTCQSRRNDGVGGVGGGAAVGAVRMGG